MKKILLSIIVALALPVATNAQTGVFKKAPVAGGFRVNKTVSAPALAQQSTSEVWWGYVDDNTDRGALGTGSTGVVDQAILISKGNAMAAGKTIKAVRFYLRDLSAISDVKVWISKTLPTSADNADILVEEIPAKALQGGDDDNYHMGKLNEVTFANPYTMGDADVYVGYSYNVTSVEASAGQYPIVLSDEDGVSGSLYLHTASIAWGAYESYGPLDLRVLFEGEFSANAVTPLDFGNAYAKVGETATATVTLSSAGSNPVTNIDYTITTDGVVGPEQHAVLSTPIALGKTGTVTINIPSDTEQGIKEKTLTVTKVNGEENNVADREAAFTLYSLNEIIDRNVVVEEFTGTGCGWCPRGMIGMQNLRNTFGDRFVGIAIHQYNGSDAMYIATNAYANLGFASAPSCKLDRGETIDPYYGTTNDIRDDFSAEMAIPALVSVAVSGQLDANATTVEATANIKPIFDGNYKLEFVLVGDKLTGTGSAWNQSNYYYQYSASQLPADLQQFGNGGTNGKSSITGWSFDDVALASSYKTNVNQVPALTLQADEEKVESYTLTLPTKATLKSAINEDELYVVALVIGADGKIINAAKAKVEKISDGISTVKTAGNNTVVARYSLDGRRVSETQKGLVIEKMADGRAVKVIR